uniref:Lectin n=1 Tax=Helianthus tuberosus TaxID=4233 RepID=A0A5B9MND0_HELTU|nr:lectin [Helianthus tuberosus]
MAGVLQNMKPAGFIRAAPKAQPVGLPEENWSFEVPEGHRLQGIKIEHGDRIKTLSFTTEHNGALSFSNVFGRWEGGETVSMVTLDSDEEIVGVKVSLGLRGRSTYVSSLSFETNKTTHGPFGGPDDRMYSLPWDKGSLVGFYGTASDWAGGIGAIGVYLKAHEEIMMIGPWGRPYNLQTRWSFQLQGNQHLDTITIFVSGNAISQLTFNSSEKVSAQSGVTIAENVVLDVDEELIGIDGTFDTLPTRQTVISSITFKTNKKFHGPFGNVKGTPFGVEWDAGSFAGFYGFHSLSFDGIGVYLKATN